VGENSTSITLLSGAKYPALEVIEVVDRARLPTVERDFVSGRFGGLYFYDGIVLLRLLVGLVLSFLAQNVPNFYALWVDPGVSVAPVARSFRYQVHD
jgi:hypothetical protein